MERESWIKQRSTFFGKKINDLWKANPWMKWLQGHLPFRLFLVLTFLFLKEISYKESKGDGIFRICNLKKTIKIFLLSNTPNSDIVKVREYKVQTSLWMKPINWSSASFNCYCKRLIAQLRLLIWIMITARIFFQRRLNSSLSFISLSSL